MTEYSNVTDLRRRSFLKLLGLAGVAATVPIELLKDPPPAVVEAAHEAYRPVSGDIWVRSVMTQARRLGTIISSRFDRNFLDLPMSDYYGWEDYRRVPTSIDINLEISPFDRRDMQVIHDVFLERNSFSADIYLFNKKITFGSAVIRQFEACMPMMDEFFRASLQMQSTPEMLIEDFAS